MSADNKEVVISVKNLRKSFGSLPVLCGVDLDIHQGEVVTVLGPSGCGKSTMLRCMNLLETPDSGDVVFRGTKINLPKADVTQARRRIGMVFQHFNVFPHLTVLENVTVAPVTNKMMSREQAEEKAVQLLQRVGLADKINEYPTKLSGGQKHSVSRSCGLLRWNRTSSCLTSRRVRWILKWLWKFWTLSKSLPAPG